MLVDDQQLIAEGLKLIIDLEDDMKVINISSDGKAALDFVHSSKPDVILMDIRMPVMNGVEATKLISEIDEDIKIVILTTFDDDDYILDALANGACGYLLKSIDSEKLVRAIKDVYQGNLLIDGKVAQKIARKAIVDSKKTRVVDLDVFSKREQEVAGFIVEGLSAKEIAIKLNLTTGTVKNYISDIYAILGTKNRSQAIVKLIDIGFK